MSNIFYKLIIVMVILSGCQPVAISNKNILIKPGEEVYRSVEEISLAGPMKAANAEISGMALYKDVVVLLPQYPDHYGDSDAPGKLFILSLDEISIFLNDTSAKALRPYPVNFDDAGIIVGLVGYEGFESITFHNDWVYMTIETKQADGMMGYVIRGTLEKKDDVYQIQLEPATMQAIPPQTDITNMTDEAILVYEDVVYTFYEANGGSVNQDAVAHRFSLDLVPLGPEPMVDFPYRLTDVSEVNSTGEFWAINYFYPGDTSLVGDIETDPFKTADETADAAVSVERIIPLTLEKGGNLQYGKQSIFSLSVSPDEARNWEGLVVWEGNGFLMVTDRFPGTILGFVSFTE